MTHSDYIVRHTPSSTAGWLVLAVGWAVLGILFGLPLLAVGWVVVRVVGR